MQQPETLPMLINPLRDLNGGQKNLFIRQHRAMIKEFCEIFGDRATMDWFNLRPATLANVKDDSQWAPTDPNARPPNKKAIEQVRQEIAASDKRQQVLNNIGVNGAPVNGVPTIIINFNVGSEIRSAGGTTPPAERPAMLE